MDARAQPVVTPQPPPIAPQPAPAPPPAVDPLATQLKPSQWRLLRDALDQGPAHGFIAGEFTPRGMDDLLNSADAGQRAQGGRVLIGAIMRYARAIKTGRLAPESFPEEWGLRPAPYDPSPDFVRAATEDRLDAWLASLPPPYAGYQGLKKALAAWRAALASPAPGADWKLIPDGPPITAETPADPRLPQVRRNLAAVGYALEVAAKGWDDQLAQVVTQFQKRHGLSPDGVIGKGALEALNVPPAMRERQIIANMERWRWLPATLPADRIQVNTVAGLLTLFQADTPVLSMRAVAGKVGNETPMLQSRVHSVVLNPPWNVPSGIAAKELYPKGRAYLARNGFRVVDGRLQQRAGPQSSLGRLKFDFNNPYSVYLHDTPSQSTFGRDDRLASHGCVRLQNPRALAEALLKNDPEWSSEAIEAGIATQKTRRVMLTQQVAVFLLYWTAYAGADGQINFRADRYGWDELLLKLIERDSGVRV